MQFLNVVSKKTYKQKDGQEKTIWLQCGTLKVTDEKKMYLDLNMFPGTQFYVFPPKDKEESPNFGGQS